MRVEEEINRRRPKSEYSERLECRVENVEKRVRVISYVGEFNRRVGDERGGRGKPQKQEQNRARAKIQRRPCAGILYKRGKESEQQFFRERHQCGEEEHDQHGQHIDGFVFGLYRREADYLCGNGDECRAGAYPERCERMFELIKNIFDETEYVVARPVQDKPAR